MTIKNTFHVQVYYEDTDHSGVVYHANYLKYFERAREHLLGYFSLVTLFEEHGIGFVVYKAELTYKKGAQFGDHVRIETTVEQESAFRLIFKQIAKLESDNSYSRRRIDRLSVCRQTSKPDQTTSRCAPKTANSAHSSL